MTITTKFNPFQVVFILHENRLVRCTVNEVITSSVDSGHSDNPYITTITYKLRPQYGNGLPSEVCKPENEVWKDSEDFLECMTKVSQNLNSK
jgi:hypothetical protein